MKTIFGIIAIVLAVIGLIFGREIQIEWTMYLGIPLVIFFGAAGLTFLTKRIEMIVAGMVIAALWPFLAESLNTALAALP